MLQAFLQTQQAHDLVEIRCVAISISPGNVHRNIDVRTRIQRGQQVEFLEYESDFAFTQAGAFRVGELREVVSIDDDMARVGASQSTQKIKKCRLAAARRADHADELTLLNADGNPAQRGHFHLAHAVRLVHIHGFDENCHPNNRYYTKPDLPADLNSRHTVTVAC